MRSDFYVYVLFRHDTRAPFYVGKGTGDRAHRSATRTDDDNLHKSAIVKRALAAGFAAAPCVMVRSAIHEALAFEIEMAFIKAIGRVDLGTGPLVNLTDGGDGEAGRVFSDAHRANLSAARRGKSYHTPESRAALSAAARGRIVSPETRAKISAAHMGTKRSFGWWSTPEGRAKHYTGMNGYRHSPETKEKMRQAAWARREQRQTQPQQ